MDKRHLLISAIPNSGSDWFASCVSDSSNHKYRREFFNPLCNWDNADVLGEKFGCESTKYSHNIFKPASRHDYEISSIIQKLWIPSGFTMTKEVWVTNKLPAMMDHFHIVCFTRSTENSMPPERSRVISWMHVCAEQLGIKENFLDSAFSAFRSMDEMCKKKAKDLNIPIILWEDLFGTRKEILKKLESCKLPSVDCEVVAEKIITTRKK